MEKEKQVKLISVLALIISIISLTIVYALISSNLIINGTGTSGKDELNIYYENLKTSASGSAKINKYPEISSNGKYIGDFEISLYEKDDSVTFCYDVVNKSRIDVVLNQTLLNNLNVDKEDKLTILKSIYSLSDEDEVVSDDELLRLSKNISIEVGMPKYLPSNSKSNDCTKITLKNNDDLIGKIKLKFKLDSVYVQK